MPKTPNLDPCQLMEHAVEVMRESIGESRDDGKPNPLVGTVPLRPDGTKETGCRGELREGNYAEFTLLERKSVSEKLDDCILFATLEPCLNRNEPKRDYAIKGQKCQLVVNSDAITIKSLPLKLNPLTRRDLLFCFILQIASKR